MNLCLGKRQHLIKSHASVIRLHNRITQSTMISVGQGHICVVVHTCPPTPTPSQCAHILNTYTCMYEWFIARDIHTHACVCVHRHTLYISVGICVCALSHIHMQTTQTVFRRKTIKLDIMKSCKEPTLRMKVQEEGCPLEAGRRICQEISKCTHLNAEGNC